MSEPLLKLLAQDDQDLQVMAAILQDSIAPVCEMRYVASEKNFLLVVHRFCWDRAKEEGAAAFERITCALDIQGIESVQFIGFDPKAPGTMLDLLTLMSEPGCLQLVFAAGAQIRLKGQNWRIRLMDFGESWPTTHLPRHLT